METRPKKGTTKGSKAKILSGYRYLKDRTAHAKCRSSFSAFQDATRDQHMEVARYTAEK
jgi:hypothetical protein